MRSGEAPSLPPLPTEEEWMRLPRFSLRGPSSLGGARQACPGRPSHPPKDPLLTTCTPQQITKTVAGSGRLAAAFDATGLIAVGASERIGYREKSGAWGPEGWGRFSNRRTLTGMPWRYG